MSAAAVSLSSIASAVFSLEAVYVLAGVILLVFAALTARDRANPHRWTSGAFWLIFGLIFIAGSWLPHAITGLLVLLMVALDGLGRVTRGHAEEASREEKEARASRFGQRIFLPVLTIPIVTFGFAVIFRQLGGDANRGALVGLGFGGLAAMAAALGITRDRVSAMMQEGRRINETMGTVSILPQLLASLGVVFTAAKVGDLIARAIYAVIPEGNLFLLVLANCLGMALFTVVMGNSFAAFPVIASGVLVPLIVQPYGVDPAMAAIITLTAGSSGTLMTPMAANFNIVPAALLNLRDPYGVIKFQLPYALALWSLHVLLMWAMARFAS